MTRACLFGFWLLAGWLVGCGSLGSNQPGPVAPPADPTPLAKCKVAASHESPLVTEWPASEKARLEALAAKQVVAVEYSGCEMKVVDACQIPGQYAFKQTTLASDTVDIANADELYAKLPLGAVNLEGQLERSGRLAIRTTVAGQLELKQLPSAELPREGPCAQVTHVVRGISVGAFRLLAGGAVAAGGGVNVVGAGAGAQSRREETTLREAGDPARCGESTPEAPHTQCASPIQVFLSPVNRPQSTAARAEELDQRRATELGGVNIDFPAREGELWSLRDVQGRVLCEPPCQRLVPLASGYYLERQPDLARVKVPERFGHAAGSRVTAKYSPEHGYPFWSALTFYGMGLPCAIGGVLTITLGLTTQDDPDRTTDDDKKGFLIGTGVMLLALAGGSAVWYFWLSDGERFETQTAGTSQSELAPGRPKSARPAVEVFFGPGSVSGRF